MKNGRIILFRLNGDRENKRKKISSALAEEIFFSFK